jgi:hypothetical protein
MMLRLNLLRRVFASGQCSLQNRQFAHRIRLLFSAVHILLDRPGSRKLIAAAAARIPTATGHVCGEQPFTRSDIRSLRSTRFCSPTGGASSWRGSFEIWRILQDQDRPLTAIVKAW